MLLTKRLSIKVEIGLAELPIGGPDRDQLDHEVFARVQGAREAPESVYLVGLFLPVDAADQVAVLNECDPYASQEHVTEMIRAMWGAALDARDQHVQTIAPGLVKRGARMSSSGLLLG